MGAGPHARRDRLVDLTVSRGEKTCVRSVVSPRSSVAAFLVFPVALRPAGGEGLCPGRRRTGPAKRPVPAVEPAAARRADREAQPEHGHGHLGQSQRHLSLSRLRHVGRARRRQRSARAAHHRQGRLPERDGRAAPAGRRPVHHAIQHHELPQEDRRVRPQHRRPAGLHRQALQRGDAHSRRRRASRASRTSTARRSTSATSAAARSSPRG